MFQISYYISLIMRINYQNFMKTRQLEKLRLPGKSTSDLM